ncbi:uncharacterized protein LOC114198379 [Eumetopias jubatus]|uniref:uncharacterized protein LOC114198379 n=1 Tax=Eumetopias jubatus TaxID=34886 RepID=UPI001016A2B3|nr:uncharacterized protein LOC114198379 [Eumetopias jubatus]
MEPTVTQREPDKADAMMGGVEAGRATSDTVRRSFTWGFCTSSSSDSAFCEAQAPVKTRLCPPPAPARVLGPISARPLPAPAPHLPPLLSPVPCQAAPPSRRGSPSWRQSRPGPAPFFPSAPEGLQRSPRVSRRPRWGWYLDEGRILLAGDHHLSRARGGEAVGGGEAPAGRGRRGRLGGLLCAVPRHCQLICGQPRGWGSGDP